MSERTAKLYKSIKLSLFSKVLSLFLSFLVTPILFNSLSEVNYGLWATILPIFVWFTFFDFGIGNGLRNKVTTCIAVDDFVNARKYIGNAFLICSIIALLFFVVDSVFYILLKFLDVGKFNQDLIEIIYFVTIVASFSFVLGLINSLFHAVQKTYFVTYGQLINTVIVFVLLLPVYFDVIENTVTFTAMVYSISLIISLLVLVIIFFKSYPHLKPCLTDFNISKEYRLLKSGLSFFVLQLASMIIFTTDKLIISMFIGPDETAKYDIAYKLFSLGIVAQSIITTPLWSATTDAIAAKDKAWVSKIIKKQVLILLGLISTLFIMAFFSDYIFYLWIGTNFDIDRYIIIMMVVFISVMSWNNIFATILNGAGVMKYQVYLATFSMVLNVPLSVFLINYYRDSAGSVLLSSIICLTLFALTSPFIVREKVIRN